MRRARSVQTSVELIATIIEISEICVKSIENYAFINRDSMTVTNVVRNNVIKERCAEIFVLIFLT